jgi:hypothetical protein
MSAFDSEEAFAALMDDMQVLYGMRAGQTVTQDDVDALNRLDKHWRDNEEDATEAFNEGRQQGLLEAGGADLVALKNKLDEQWAQTATDKVLRKFERQWGFRDGAQACREMMARFVEQGGDRVIAGSIRANWNPQWGEDPGVPPEDVTQHAGEPREALATEPQSNLKEQP